MRLRNVAVVEVDDLVGTAAEAAAYRATTSCPEILHWSICETRPL
jgi:hypothetical protein